MPVNTTAVGYVPVNITGDTMTGLLVLSGDPVVALGAATKQYADAIAAGFTVKTACVVSTTANLTATYNNGAAGVGATLTNSGAMVAFSADGVTPNVGDRILVPFQTGTEENGIYEVTDAGSGATNWILTRTTDYDSAAEITPGSFVPVTMGTLYAQTSWIQTATVVTVGTDPIVFSQFTASPSTFAVVGLTNLSGVAINTTLVSDTDVTDNLGSFGIRWNTLYAATISTGHTAAQTTVLGAWDVDGASLTPFITLTANNTPTCVLASDVTGTTQAPGDNSTKLATTAYADAISAAGANTALSNLAAVAINTTLLPGLDSAIDLGSETLRFQNTYSNTIRTGQGATHAVLFQAYDVDGAAYTTFATLTANNTPTFSLASEVTGTTQAASNNSTRLATTAYVDTQVLTTGASRALNNLAAVAINTSLLPGADNAIDLGDGTHRTRQIFSAGLTTGTTAADTLIISARDVDGASNTAFITLTANNTPTCALSGEVTGATQAPLDNSTKLATTAYVDAATGGGSGANTALSNLASVAINTSLVSDTDVTDNLGSFGIRWDTLFAATLSTGHIAAQTMVLGAWDVDGAALTPFITLTANNTPTCVLASDVIGTTQAPGDNSTKLATTAYVDSASGGANTALSNLAAVAINTTLISDTDATDSLGSGTVRWLNLFATAIKTGTGAGNTTIISAHDVDGATDTPFITLTANNTPTCVLASAVTGTTQAPLDNSTKLATTAYVDAATGGGSGANVALSNLAGVAINTTLVSDTDVTDNLGTQAIRWNNIYAATVQTGDTAADTLQLGAWDVDGAAFVPFITMTANNTPTCTLSGSITGVTQSLGTNNTQLATTAFVIAETGTGGAAANNALSNLGTTAVNATLIPGGDISVSLGTTTVRYLHTYTSTLRTGTTNGNTLLLQARDVDGAAYTTFITLTAANTPTCEIAGATITGGTIASLTSPLAVASGGTGLASATAYAVLCGGTTSTGAFQSIASVGTAGQALVSNGAGALPTFQTISGIGGSLTFLGSATASASATVDFANLLTATYDNYLLEVQNLLPVTDATTHQMRVGTGATPTYQTTSYSGCGICKGGAANYASGTGAMDLNLTSRMGNDASRTAGMNITVHNANGSTDKTINAMNAYWDSTGNIDDIACVSGRWQSSTVITSLRFLQSSGNISTGNYKLYGIANS